MNFNDRVVYDVNNGKEVFCFNHAVEAANKGIKVETRIVNVGYYNMAQYDCKVCMTVKYVR